LKLNKNESEGTKKPFAFSLKNDVHEFLFRAADATDHEKWVNVIEINLQKDPKPPLEKEKKKSRLTNLKDRTKKNVGGKLATSALGKKALQSQTPDEIKNLIKALRVIVEKESKSEKRAKIIEQNLYKIGVKCYFLIDSNTLSFNDFLEADRPLRNGLELLSKCHDHAKYSRKLNEPLLKERLNEVEKCLREASDVLKKLLSPHIKPQNVQRIDDSMNSIGTADFLEKILLDPDLAEEVQELVNASEHYTQFHFYANEK